MASPTAVAADFHAVFAPEQLHVRRAQRLARAHDASHYLLTPRIAVTAADAGEVAQAMVLAQRYRLAVTFRAGGTSLSGQAGGAGMLIDTRQHFRSIEVLDGGTRVRCEPGATVRAVNARLAPYGTMLGPDPASEIAATIGGVVANNSSGMACGTWANSYQTVESLVIVLPSGTRLDTSLPDAHLRAAEPELYAGLSALREQVMASPAARATIAKQYSMKNTMGYGLNSLVDFERPADILAHLMIGSEGTLGFVASATLRTIPVLPQASTALLVFSSIHRATDALEPLLAAGARTLELMDPASLRVVQPWLPQADPLRHLDIAAHTALLVEAQAATDAELSDGVGNLEKALGALTLATPARFTRDARERAQLWQLRKGLYTAVAGARKPGTTALLEDVAVPVAQLSTTTDQLGQLLAGHGYTDAVIFGHAKDGNLHFMLSPRLGDARELATYERFTQDMVDLILDQGGTLKAEHGTGRIMAPYVERQFGPELYQVMRRIKELCDPGRLLGPGVIITDNPREHLEHLKMATAVDPAVDACVECGYCEPTCPSRDLTTTPRQRIALMREMAEAGPAQARALRRDFEYDAVDTCAADSLCVRACPVHIDTGAVMKAQRAARLGPGVQAVGAAVARHWAPITVGLRAALGVARFVPGPVLRAATGAARTVLPPDWIPALGSDLPGPGQARSRLAAATDAPRPGRSGTSVADAGTRPGPTRPAGPQRADAAHGAAPAGHAPDPAAAKPDPTVRQWAAASGMAPGSTSQVVLFPSCIDALFGSQIKGGTGASFMALAQRAGVQVIIPEGIDALCCSTPWLSKGLTRGHREMATLTFRALWEASGGGQIPVVCEALSCSERLLHLGASLDEPDAAAWDRVTRLDPLGFAVANFQSLREELTGGRLAGRRLGAVAVHPTCSAVHLDEVDALHELAGWCAAEVFVPPSWGCCAFAGDRGMLHPELTAAATAPEAADVWAAERARAAAGGDGHFDAYVSANRTCEMGISRATGRDYVHVLDLLARLTA